MSKIHITLVGGQTAPVYWGIMESNPDKVIFICSQQSQEEADRLKSEIAFPSEAIITDPVDLTEISKRATQLAEQYRNDEISLNLTGGPKPWNLFFFKIFEKEPNASLFYIDQNNLIWNLKTYQSHNIAFDTESLFKLYGTPIKSYVDLADYTPQDIEVIKQIESLRSYSFDGFNALTQVRQKNADYFNQLPDSSYIKCNEAEGWVELSLLNKQGKTRTERLKSEHITELIFNTGWFEFKMAHLLSKWSKAKNIRLNCRFTAKNNVEKNEIDIIVNTGTKLLFVECKTQIKMITDIDKFHSAVKNFGGMGSKALFITDAPMRQEAKEKCKDNDILAFSLQDYKSGFWTTEQSLFMILDKELTTLNKR